MARVLTEEHTLHRQARWAWAGVAVGWGMVPLAIAGLLWRQAPLLAWALIPILVTLAGQWTHRAMATILGYGGERAVDRVLRALPDDYLLFNGLTLWVDGRQAQLDHVLLSPYGLWCVETKSLRGAVYGTETEKRWQQVKRSDSGRHYRNAFYSPVRQNATHCRRLHAYLLRHGLHVAVRSLIVFTTAELHVRTTTPVIPLAQLPGVIHAHDTQPQFTSHDVTRIAHALLASAG
ncbi:MAG TPA: nuclease-related domain-containing protein [Armatimonadota bacterium]|jgi:hypothetical protein